MSCFLSFACWSRRADWRAGTGFSFAVLEPRADGAAGDLVGGVSLRGLASEAVSGEVGCRVADKAGFTLSAVLPPLLPEFPDDGHLHIRLAG